MSSEEKQFALASKFGESYFVCSVMSRRKQLVRRCLYCLFLGVLLVGAFLFKLSGFVAYVRSDNPFIVTTAKHKLSTGQSNDYGQCPQVGPLSPKHTTFRLNLMDRYLASARYEGYSAKLLSKAIQYRTVSYDEMADADFPLDDPLYLPFRQFFDQFIRVNFPRVTQTLQLEHVNRHGLLYTWEGSDSDLNPTVLLAHQDVVPVNEEFEADWKYSPWGGEIAEGRVWGRGSSGGKHATVGILEAVEALIAAGFTPKRTTILAFGFDEEIGGQKGGMAMAEEALRLYEGRIAAIIGEGGAQVEQWGQDMVIMGVAEKGQMPIKFEVRTPGGPASLPVEHDGIGITAQIVAEIEALHYDTYLSEDHPLLGFLTCAQEHADGFPDVLKPLLGDRLAGNIPPRYDDRLAKEFFDDVGSPLDPVRWALKTLKSINIIQGGVQTNAIPARVITSANIRINPGENITSIEDDYSKILRRVAQENIMEYIDFGEDSIEGTSNHYIRAWTDRSTEPTKVSPYEIRSRQATPWSVVVGTSINVIGQDSIVAPGMFAGNSDARHYHRLSDHIYRYTPGLTLPELLDAGTERESIRISNHVKGVHWYSKVIRNMDEATFEGERRRGRDFF